VLLKRCRESLQFAEAARSPEFTARVGLAASFSSHSRDRKRGFRCAKSLTSKSRKAVDHDSGGKRRRAVYRSCAPRSPRGRAFLRSFDAFKKATQSPKQGGKRQAEPLIYRVYVGKEFYASLQDPSGDGKRRFCRTSPRTRCLFRCVLCSPKSS